MTIPQKHTTTTMKASAVPLEFQTVLRLRPLLKREREDPIVLEPLPLEENQAPSVALHPLPLKNSSGESLTPSSALVLQTLSPENVHTGHDVEFKFDHILNADSNQDQVYSTIGLSTALSAMEPLKEPGHDRKTHLLISMGVSGSGKSYTCFGSHPGKRKVDTDGLVPRMMDSLFRQSKHHVHKRNEKFAVDLQVLQVNQAKNGKTSSNDCELYDLLQEPKNHSNSSILSSGTSTVRNMVANFERNTSTTSSSTSKSSNSSAYSNMDEPVSIEQDAKSADFRVVNGQTRTCKTLEQARESLQTALQHSRKVTNNKRHQSHVLIQLQPILMDKNGKTVAEGGTIAVLDMAGLDSLPGSSSTRSKRGKDTLPSRDDAHTAVLHCLRSLQHNDKLWSQISQNSNLQRQPSGKKVPYLQHKLTMLLQPLFSPAKTDSTLVALLLSAYPGHRDYAEKKVLLHDFESLHVARPASRAAETGLPEVNKQKPSPIKKLMKQHHRRSSPLPAATIRSSPSNVPTSLERKTRKKDRRKVVQPNAASDADDEHSENEQKTTIPKEIFKKAVVSAPTIPAAASMTYSDSSLDDDEDYVVPVPPPLAPSYSIRTPKLPPAIPASAPMEEEHVAYSMGIPIPGGSDFPGVPQRSPLAENSNNEMEPNKPVEKSLPVATLVDESPDRTPFQATSMASKHGPSSSGCSSKFSPFKTFNMVVSASKKKGKEVMVKVRDATLDPERAAPFMPNAPPMSQDDNENDGSLQLRLIKLEAQNIKLFRENSSLRDKNEKLKKENDELKAALEAIKATPSDEEENDEQNTNTTLRSTSRENQNATLRPASSENRPDLSRPNPGVHEEVRRPSWVKETTTCTGRPSWASEKDDEENWEQSRRDYLGQKSSNVDDPLMQHIAQLSDQSMLGGSNSWNATKSKSQFSHNYPSSFTRAGQWDRSNGLK